MNNQRIEKFYSALSAEEKALADRLLSAVADIENGRNPAILKECLKGLGFGAAGLKLGGVFTGELYAPQRNIITNQIKMRKKVELLPNGRIQTIEVPVPDYASQKWADGPNHNIVTNQGIQHILDILFVSATAQIDPWYVVLSTATPTYAAGDTPASHAGWTEFTNFTESVRQTYTDVRAVNDVTNSAAKASHAINTDTQTIGGSGLISVSTKSDGTGTFLSGVAFTGGNKAADDGDTLEVTYVFSGADDGV